MKINFVWQGRVFNAELSSVVLNAWFFLTYPLQILMWYWMFGWQGVIFGVAMIALNHRGKL